MITDYMRSYIRTSVRCDAVGDHSNPVIDVEWSEPQARISRSFLDDFPSSGDLYEIGPYIAQVVPESYDFVGDSYTIVKVDHPLAWFYVAKWRTSKKLQWFTSRLIYTLAVWELANKPDPGDRIGWYLVKERWS